MEVEVTAMEEMEGELMEMEVKTNPAMVMEETQEVMEEMNQMP